MVKMVKSLVSEHRVTTNILNSLKNCITALPSYCFITLTEIEIEALHLSVSEMVGVFVSILTAGDKYSLRNRKNLPQPIQLQFSKTPNIFLNFLLHI